MEALRAAARQLRHFGVEVVLERTRSLTRPAALWLRRLRLSRYVASADPRGSPARSLQVRRRHARRRHARRASLVRYRGGRSRGGVALEEGSDHVLSTTLPRISAMHSGQAVELEHFGGHGRDARRAGTSASGPSAGRGRRTSSAHFSHFSLRASGRKLLLDSVEFRNSVNKNATTERQLFYYPHSFY